MAQKTNSVIGSVAKKIAKRYGWSLPELTPFIGFLWPGNIILVWKTLGGDIIGPEGVLMLPIAIFAYGIALTIGIIELWFDLGIFTTLITWAIWGFFVAWKEIRGIGSGKK